MVHGELFDLATLFGMDEFSFLEGLKEIQSRGMLHFSLTGNTCEIDALDQMTGCFLPGSKPVPMKSIHQKAVDWIDSQLTEEEKQVLVSMRAQLFQMVIH